MPTDVSISFTITLPKEAAEFFAVANGWTQEKGAMKPYVKALLKEHLADKLSYAKRQEISTRKEQEEIAEQNQELDSKRQSIQ